MFCPFCGCVMPDDSVFCGNCGKSLTDSQQGRADRMPKAAAGNKSSTSPKVLIVAAAGVVVAAGLVIGGIFIVKNRLASDEQDNVIAEDQSDAGENVTDDPEADKTEEGKADTSEKDSTSEETTESGQEIEETGLNTDETESTVTEKTEADQTEDVTLPGSDSLAEDWFDEEGLMLNRPGTYSFKGMIVDSDQNDLMEDTVTFTVNITEKEDESIVGYKDVTAYYEVTCTQEDLSDNQGPDFWVNVFDRKTGSIFPTFSEHLDGNGLFELKRGDETIRVGAETEFGKKDDSSTLQCWMTIRVPEDYMDGVFSIGYCSRALSREYYQIDHFDSEELPRMDETVFFRKNNGKDYFYFAAYK